MRKPARRPGGAFGAASEALINRCGESSECPAVEEVHVDAIRVVEETGQCQRDGDRYLNIELVEAQTRPFLIKGSSLALQSKVW